MTKLYEQIKFAEVVKYEPKERNYVIASDSGVTERDMDAALSELAKGEGDAREDHIAMGQQIVEPIWQTVPYKRWTDRFFMPASYEEREDNIIPLEAYVSFAYETNQESEPSFVQAGFGFTRPTFKQYETGIAVQWVHLKKAGWNFLQRQMIMATAELARKIDLDGQAAIDAGVSGQAGQGSVVSGGLMTKAAVDAVIKAAQTNAFPVTTAAINSGTVTDMSAWSGGPFYTASLPPAKAEEILDTLYLGRYGGVEWYASPFVPTDFIYFGGPAANVGYEQTRGTPYNVSDVDIYKRRDVHVIMTPEKAFYVGNALQVRRLRIIA